MKRIVFLVWLLASCSLTWAASPWSGTWVLRDNAKGQVLTMIVEDVGPGWKITYKIAGQDAQGRPATFTSTVETNGDGKDSPHLLEGKFMGQTFGIRKIDDRHTVAVLKYEGKQTGISKTEISPDGKVLKVENDNAVTSPNGPVGKSTQYFDRK